MLVPKMCRLLLFKYCLKIIKHNDFVYFNLENIHSIFALLTGIVQLVLVCLSSHNIVEN